MVNSILPRPLHQPARIAGSILLRAGCGLGYNKEEDLALPARSIPLPVLGDVS